LKLQHVNQLNIRAWKRIFSLKFYCDGIIGAKELRKSCNHACSCRKSFRIRNIFDTSLDNVRRYTAFLEEAQLVHSLEKFS
jgi:hypothetical protein